MQTREAQGYRYRVTLDDEAPVRIEPAELFKPDDNTGRAGEFAPAEAVGHLAVEVIAGNRRSSTTLEVRSAKLEYETEYRQMLRDVSEFAAEALVQGFQPAAGAFESSESASAELLYRRFAMVHARLSDTDFQAAIGHILSRPHQAWQSETEYRPPSCPLGGGHALQRALVRGRPRRDWPDAPPGTSLNSLPRNVEVTRHETTPDTLPNRLVRFALDDWRAVALITRDAARHLSGAPRRRALDATAQVLERLDEWLAHPLFRSVGALTTFPQGNQVLLKREGYRQLFAAWMVSSAGADLAIDLEDPVRISQRSVATMYEYWCFLQLANLLADMCGQATASHSLFHSVSGGMALGLRKGQTSQLEWETTIAGRRLKIGLFFNRSFKATDKPGSGSWSLELRPDCSVRIRPLTGLSGGDSDRFETWLHFDAKYRVDQTQAAAADLVLSDDVQPVESLGLSKTADLVKMHAYRDAIRSSAGAYVLFPGTTVKRFALDSEALPGIGAFPLRPANDGGGVSGRDELRGFLNEVLVHAASQATRYERRRFWERRVAIGESLIPAPAPPMDWLELPPADTSVLLVEVDHRDELEAVLMSRECALPNHRVDTSAQLILFHGDVVTDRCLFRRVSEWYSGRNPFAEVAMCCRVEPIDDAPRWIRDIDLTQFLAVDHPCVLSWLDLARTASAGS